MSEIPEAQKLSLKLSPAQSLASRERLRITGPFLAGPVKWRWLQLAGQLPGRALHVALVLVFRAGVLKTRDDIPMPLPELKEMGVRRHTARRGLIQLENAGLVTITRAPGQKTRVKLPEIDEEVVDGSQ